MRLSFAVILTATLSLSFLPAVLAHDQTPGNRIANGGFDQGFNGWSNHNVPSSAWISPLVRCTGDNAMAIGNQYSGAFLSQVVNTSAGYSVFDFGANVTANPGNTGPQMAEIATNFPVAGHNLLVRVILAANSVSLVVFDGTLVKVPATISGCHHYVVALNDVSRTGILYQDSTPIIYATGGPAFTPYPTGTVYVGDVAGNDGGAGPAPDVLYGGLYFGPS